MNIDQGDTVARMLATTHLVDCAEDWERLGDDPRLPLHMRTEAYSNACAIWNELMWRPGDKR